MEEITVTTIQQTVAVAVAAEEVVVPPPAAEVVTVQPPPAETIAVGIEEPTIAVEVPAVLGSGPPPAGSNEHPYLLYQFGGAEGEFTVHLDCSRSLAFWLDLRGVAVWSVVHLVLLNVPSGVFSEIFLLLDLPAEYSLAVDFPGSLPTYWPAKGVATEYVIRSWDAGATLALLTTGHYAF